MKAEELYVILQDCTPKTTVKVRNVNLESGKDSTEIIGSHFDANGFLILETL